MKKLLIYTFFHLICFSAFSVNEIDSLLKVLDTTIKEQAQYNKEKQQRIISLEKQLQQRGATEQLQYSILGQLFEEYKGYQMDSAMQIADKRIVIAEHLKDAKLIAISNMNLAEIMGMTGMYKEALDILAEQKPARFDREEQLYYYHLYHSIYILMSDYSISKKERIHYDKLIYQYKDSILLHIKPDEMAFQLVKSSQLLMMGDYDQALDLANKCYLKFGDNNHSVAMITYILADVYHHKGNRKEETKYLAISAIGDLKAGVKEYISLRKLAILLYEDGDINRSYNYMKRSMEDAIFCNARLRTLEISRMLPLINATYDMKMKEERNRLVYSLIVISIMAFILVGATLYIYKQLKTLSKIRKSQKAMNEDLKTMNEDLNLLNSKLSEANHVKEEYIGYVFSICSTYIDKLENFRKVTNRKIKAGQIDELQKITSSSSFAGDELKEFYRNFDTIFLNLYPNFIEEFNSLLSPEESITPKEGDLLTPELRIFALVRLGINDSIKIADFLHYSPQTVYNYRLKVRNKAIVSKEDFSVAINQIGQLKA